MTATAIVLAGGLGTRLRSRLGELPKPMAPIADRPFLAYLLDQLWSFQYSKIVLSVGYRAGSIREHFGESYGGMALVYSEEEKPLGTGGAIVAALQLCHDPSVTVLNGDTYLELDYTRFAQSHVDSRAPLSIALRHVDNTERYGRVDVVGDVVVGFHEKGADGPGLVNAGTYQVNRDLFRASNLPETFSFERDFLMPDILRLRPHGFRSLDYMIDIGIPEDYDRAQVELPVRASA